MGIAERYIRDDLKAGSVDLSLLAEPPDSWERPVKVSLRTEIGLWYALSPVDETEAHPQTSLQPDNTIYPVNLEFEPWARINGGIVEETYLGLWHAVKWARERRHFHVGAVSLLNSVITEGDRLTINGHRTSPVDIAWVTELVHPDSGIRPHMNYIGNTPAGEYVSVGVRTLPNF